MTRARVCWLVVLNIGLSVAAAVGVTRLAPPPDEAFATVDVAELYRLKEAQVTARLLNAETTDAGREAALREASSFGEELSALIGRLPAECRCLILSRGALIASTQPVPDLTARLREQLGLETE